MSRLEGVYNCCLFGIIKYKDLIEKEMIMDYMERAKQLKNQVRTVGELRKRLEGLPDDLILHQRGVMGEFLTIMNLVVSHKGDENFEEVLSSIKRKMSLEEKIRGTYRTENVDTIVLFNHGSHDWAACNL